MFHVSRRARGALCVVVAVTVGQMRLWGADTYDHVVIVIEENQNFSSVIGSHSGNNAAPYINNTLVAGGTLFSNFYGLNHPSQPNYLQLFSGSNQGVTTNSNPSGTFTTANLGDALQDVGKTFGGYSESLPSVGSNVTTNTTVDGTYARKHNPWVNWQGAGTNQLSASVNMPFTSFTALGGNYAALPNVSIVVPSLINDMHDGTILQGDTWLQQKLGAYATWAKANNSLLIVTFDEDGFSENNRIPTIFYGAGIKEGATVSTTYTLHNLLRTVGDYYGAAPAGVAANLKPVYGARVGEDGAVVRAYQQGHKVVPTGSNYTGTVTNLISSAAVNTAGTGTNDVGIDGDTTNGGVLTPTQLLVKFGSIFSASTVPAGSKILSAKLTFTTNVPGSSPFSVDTFKLYRMKKDWSAGSTWNSLVNGVSMDGLDALAAEDFTVWPYLSTDPSPLAIFDVTDTIQAWSDGDANYGWVLVDASPTGVDGWRVFTEFNANSQPLLEITYLTVPEPAGLTMWGLGVAGLVWRRRRRRG